MKEGCANRGILVGKANFHFAAALTLICFYALPAALAQTLTIRPIKNFKVPEYYPSATPGGTNHLKSLLTGATARLRPDGRALISTPRIEHYNETGETQLVVRAAECIFDNKTKTASSTNTLQLQTADGKFYIEGVGFHWNQTNSNLIISNQVRTIISRPLVESTSAKPNPAKPNPGKP